MAVGVGFYGNSETNDGVYQLTYSMYNANHTLGGVDSLVSGHTSSHTHTYAHTHTSTLWFTLVSITVVVKKCKRMVAN